jgi:hypothetical protein
MSIWGPKDNPSHGSCDVYSSVCAAKRHQAFQVERKAVQEPKRAETDPQNWTLRNPFLGNDYITTCSVYFWLFNVYQSTGLTLQPTALASNLKSSFIQTRK